MLLIGRRRPDHCIDRAGNGWAAKIARCPSQRRTILLIIGEERYAEHRAIFAADLFAALSGQ